MNINYDETTIWFYFHILIFYHVKKIIFVNNFISRYSLKSHLKVSSCDNSFEYSITILEFFQKKKYLL